MCKSASTSSEQQIICIMMVKTSIACMYAWYECVCMQSVGRDHAGSYKCAGVVRRSSSRSRMEWHVAPTNINTTCSWQDVHVRFNMVSTSRAPSVPENERFTQYISRRVWCGGVLGDALAQAMGLRGGHTRACQQAVGAGAAGRAVAAPVLQGRI